MTDYFVRQILIPASALISSLPWGTLVLPRSSRSSTQSFLRGVCAEEVSLRQRHTSRMGTLTGNPLEWMGDFPLFCFEHYWGLNLGTCCAINHLSLLILRQGLTKLAKLAMNSLCRAKNDDSPSSVS